MGTISFFFTKNFLFKKFGRKSKNWFFPIVNLNAIFLINRVYIVKSLIFKKKAIYFPRQYKRNIVKTSSTTTKEQKIKKAIFYLQIPYFHFNRLITSKKNIYRTF